MKHDQLRSIAHNIADSLAGGCGLLIGVYEMDVFGEAAGSPDGYLMVDFLTGTTSGATPSDTLAKAVRLYAVALPDLCVRHGVSANPFRTLTARFERDALERHVTITIEDEKGRRSTDTYVGVPLKHLRTMDGIGRIRTRRS